MLFRNQFFREVYLLPILSIFLLVASLLPAIFTPLLADDLQVAFSASNQIEQSWLQQIANGLNTYGDGGHFNVLGQIFSYLYMKLWAELSIMLGLDLLWGFWLQKIFVYLIVIVSIKIFISRNTETYSRKIDFALIAIFFSSLIQLHTPWSNDPVTNFVIGFACVPYALIAIDRGIRAIKKSDLGNLILWWTSSLIAILIYEINFAVLIAVSAIICTRLFNFEPQSTLNSRFSNVISLGIKLILLPVILILGLKGLQPTQVIGYEGTAISSNAQSFLQTFKICLESLVPTISWKDAALTVGGFFNSQFGIIASLCILTVSSIITWKTIQFSQQAKADKLSAPFASPALIAILIYGLSAVAIQASTVKIQVEVTHPGSVYTFYAPGFVAVVIALVMFVSRHKTLLPTVLIVATGLGFVQFNSNLSINQWLRTQFWANSSLTYLATNDANKDIRCTALAEWQNIPYPQYYKDSILQGINKYQQHKWNREFC